MAQTVGEFFVQRLQEWGVHTIFGYPGDGINGVLRGLEKAGDDFLFVQARHEEMAAFMASAYAKFSGEIGVCLATGGPGATHLITGLYDAKLDHMPVLAITGQASRSARGAHYQQELNLDRVFADVADYVQEGLTPQQIGVILDRAIRTAKSRNARHGDRDAERPLGQQVRGADALARLHALGPGLRARRTWCRAMSDLRRAAEVLNAGKKVALLVGAGALQAVDEVIAVADRLQAGAAKALLGKAALPDDLPWVTGTIGLLGSKPSLGHDGRLRHAADDRHRLPVVGVPAEDGQARAVQIDIDPTMLGIRYPTEVNLHGDSAETLRALLPLLRPEDRRRLARRHRQGDGRLVEADGRPRPRRRRTRSTRSASPGSCRRACPTDVIVTSDSGSCANWFARDLRMRRGMMCSLSGGLASMGAAVPYAIGAKFAHPDRPVIALVGDGAMQMNNMAELITVAKYWRRWPNPKWICCVWNNEDLNQVTWEQRVMEGFPKFEATQQVPDVPYHRFAELIGLKGIYVDDPERMGSAWDEALAADVPVVLEVKTDPEVPPLPPHITFKQAKNFMNTLQQGDPDASGMIKGALHQVFAAVTPEQVVKREPPRLRRIARRATCASRQPRCARSVLARQRGRALPRQLREPGACSRRSAHRRSASSSRRMPQRAAASRARLRGPTYALALAVGAAGLGFHLFNVLRRPGGARWLNLFYAAPIGAPAALGLAGALGFAGDRVAAQRGRVRIFGLPAGRVLCALVAAGLAGTIAEVGLLHYRGSFQNPFMWLPVSVPPVAAALTAKAALEPGRQLRPHRLTRWWLRLTAFLGIAGVGFHGYGISRAMGGWRNWQQNVVDGPPLPAPPSFSALAIAGLAALRLQGARRWLSPTQSRRTPATTCSPSGRACRSTTRRAPSCGAD